MAHARLWMADRHSPCQAHAKGLGFPPYTIVPGRSACRSSSEECGSLGRLDDAACVAPVRFAGLHRMVGAQRPRGRPGEAVKAAMGNRLYVGNLSFNTTQAA